MGTFVVVLAGILTLRAGWAVYRNWRWLRSPEGVAWRARVRAIHQEIWSRDDEGGRR